MATVRVEASPQSTVSVFERFRGKSGSKPRSTLMWYESSCSG